MCHLRREETESEEAIKKNNGNATFDFFFQTHFYSLYDLKSSTKERKRKG